MGIVPALTSLMSGLDAELSLQDATREMRRIAHAVAEGSPIGYKVKGYAGQGVRTVTPWVGIFDPGVSERPNVGLYVAYICHPGSASVTLTLQQGSDNLREQVGASAARSALRQRADWVRFGSAA